MIYLAKELKAKLKYLVLSGQNYDRELEWIGTSEQWMKTLEEENN